MAKRHGWLLLIVAGMVLSSCAAEPSATTLTESGTTPTTTAVVTADTEAFGTYLVEISNLASEIESDRAEFHDSYMQQYWPCFSSSVIEEECMDEPPPQFTDEERFEQEHGLWTGIFDLYVAHASRLESVTAPAGFESGHQALVDAYRAYFAHLGDQVAGFTTLAEFEAFLAAAFDPLAELSSEQTQLLVSLVEACDSIETQGDQAGYRMQGVDLGCPSLPPEPVTVDLDAGDNWVAAPSPLPVGDGLVIVRITNTGAEPIRPVVLQIFEGDPLDLPVIDGLVDLTRSGQFEPDSGYAAFDLAYAGEDAVFLEESGVRGEPPQLSPGESVEAVVWSEGTLVVFDYRRGEFEAGAVAVIERAGR